MDEQKTYFQKFCEEYGITEENNKVKVRQTDIKHGSPTQGETILVEVPIFSYHEKGFSIKPFTLSRNHIIPTRDEAGKATMNKNFEIIRLEVPYEDKHGNVRKYHIPKGQGTPPFIPVNIIEAYEEKKQIKTLILTEGYKKAFKASMHGLYCIGLISITCMIDKKTKKLHSDIVDIITACKVERLVWLTDNDCRSITTKPLDDEIDLSKRVNGFFNSINKFQELTSGLDDVKKYFAHVDEDLTSKGLDDLLIDQPDNISKIVKELTSFDKIDGAKYVGNYFTKFNITYGVAAVRTYMMLNDVNQFYLHHVEKRKELAGKKFRFYGTLYSYNQKDGKCVIEVPRDAKYYFRVGDAYYEYIEIPNKYHQLTRTYVSRQKSTINDDCGKDVFKHIQKYKAFCNVPSHENYQRDINNCFNVYSPFEFEPEDGECTQTITYLKHLFGENEIQLTTGETVKNYELGLDYLTILYKNPQQMLPILCFVSAERRTGKSTFVKWLKILFSENCAVIGNDDFENGFNAHWTSKFLVCVDETRIDKEKVVEKIKSLATANHTMMNAKGKDQVQLEIFMKFILLSNNERNFINIEKEEVRFWINKVQSIKQEIFDLEKDMATEIPAFLNFLNKRKMVTKQEFRHWFNPDYLKTDALALVQENSAPSIWKILKSKLEDHFDNLDVNELAFTTDNLLEFIKNTKADSNYLKRILNERGYFLSKTASRKKLYKRIIVPSGPKLDGQESESFEKWTSIDQHGRVYIFKREDFTDHVISATQSELFNEVAPAEKPATELFVDELPF